MGKLSPFTKDEAKGAQAVLGGVAQAFEESAEDRFTGQDVANIIRAIGEQVVTRTAFERDRQGIRNLRVVPDPDPPDIAA